MCVSFRSIGLSSIAIRSHGRSRTAFQPLWIRRSISLAVEDGRCRQHFRRRGNVGRHSCEGDRLLLAIDALNQRLIRFQALINLLLKLAHVGLLATCCLVDWLQPGVHQGKLLFDNPGQNLRNSVDDRELLWIAVWFIIFII